MKRTIYVIAAVCAVLIVAGAAAYLIMQDSDGSQEEQPETPDIPDVPESTSSLVVYFSRTGTTENVAQEIQRQTGADIFEIVPAVPYTADYSTLLGIAQEELRTQARPDITGSIDVSGYGVIYIGFPIWHGDAPMVIYTFLQNHDLSGKTIIPFCTSGGSGVSTAVGNISSAEPDADVLSGHRFTSSQSSAVSSWLRDIGQL